jgi:hypothetical protein
MRVYFSILSIAFLSFCHTAHSQNIVEELREFYANADMDCYKDKVQKRITTQRDLFYQWDLYFPPPLQQSNTVPILNIQFVNMENFSFSDGIYNYITIDSVWIFSFIYVDKKMTAYAFSNFPAPFRSYGNAENIMSKQLIKNIRKQQPELILYCFALDSGFGKIFNNGFMYLKGDKIYIYDKYDKKNYELDGYFREFFRLRDVRQINYTCLPIEYQDEACDSFRRTGSTPEEWKMICPPISKE